jgi:hypothetical protein
LFVRLSKDRQGVVFDPEEVFSMMRHVQTNLVRQDTAQLDLRFFMGFE